MINRVIPAALVIVALLAGCGHPEPEPRLIRTTVLEAALSDTGAARAAMAERIRRAAEEAMAVPLQSVMDKREVPPSGDRHDFLSPAPLWWPDPEQTGGVPYVWNREGKINPEYHETGDQRAFEAMAGAVEHLALASLLTGESRFGARARDHLRRWFIDPETRMNPHLRHAWFERGRNAGTPFGIMSLERLPVVLDAASMLEQSGVWRAEDRSGMSAWVDAYLRWLTESPMGRDAERLWNRFGTLHDVQAAACALYLSREARARRIIERSVELRINRLVRRDGRQPYALEREITFFNSVSSVGYFFQLATMGEGLGIDLWHARGSDGGSIRRALEFVAPYADPAATWPYILEVRRGLLRPVLQQAAVVYDDAEYRRLLGFVAEAASPPAYDLYPLYYDAHQDTLTTDLMILEQELLSPRAGRDHPEAMRILRAAADEALRVRPVSVMEKSMTPPSGSKHDFLSIGGYYWPDPAKPDGLPWIYRDGKVNPTYGTTGDGEQLRTLMRAVPVLALAYRMTGEEAYAEHAARMLRRWFLDPATRMNPNMRYAHAQPGVMEGSYYGIIHLGGMPVVMDAAGMLRPSRAWTAEDQAGLRAWSAEFLDWMLHDESAPEAGRVWNNHGTNYDLVAVRFALMAGRRGIARELLERVKTERIDRQIRPDGRLPYELERNRAWGYTAATLDKFVQLATMGRRLGIDLWNHTSAESGGIRAAVDYLAVYADSTAVWPFADLDMQRHGRMPLARLRSILQRAALAYAEPAYGDMTRTLPVDPDLLREHELPFLFYPDAPADSLLERIGR